MSWLIQLIVLLCSFSSQINTFSITLAPENSHPSLPLSYSSSRRFLAKGLEIPAFRIILPSLLTAFGLLPTASPFDFASTFFTVCGASYALPAFLLNSEALIQKGETQDAKASRQLANLGIWFGTLVAFAAWTSRGNQGGYLGCPFNLGEENLIPRMT